jgi:hypothetical protein
MQRLSTLLALLTLITVGCAQAPSDVEAEELTDLVLAKAAEPVDPVSLCEVVFTPDPELLVETTEATSRWAQTTGCDIHVGENGFRVRLADKIIDSAGRKLEGRTWVDNNELVIDLAPSRTKFGSNNVLTHEIGHVLSVLNGNEVTAETAHVEDDGVSLMSESGGNTYCITANDLVLICGGLQCQTMSPEEC